MTNDTPTHPDLATYLAAVILARPVEERFALYVSATRAYRQLLVGHPTSASFAVRGMSMKFNRAVLALLEASNTSGDLDEWRTR